MARLRRLSPVGNGDSDDADFRPTAQRQPIARGQATRNSPRKKQVGSAHLDAGIADKEDIRSTLKLVAKSAKKGEQRTKQIRLAPLSAQSLQRAAPDKWPVLDRSFEPITPSRRTRRPLDATLSASRTVRQHEGSMSKVCSEDDLSEIEIEESLWHASDTSSESEDLESELPSIRKLLSLPPASKAPVDIRVSKPFNTFEAISAASTTATCETSLNRVASSRPGSSSDKENHNAFLRFSPPRLFSPPRPREQDRLRTPPQSPSKSRLQSPSKTRSRLPTPPGRPSLDTFWNADAVNDWNDQYSPQKVLKSPKKLKFLREQEHSPSSSLRKITSPSKASKEERKAKKTFESSKHGLASDFLAELDNSITNGQLQTLSASTGGIQLIWSKTLNSTAGRANWRKETTKTTLQHGEIELSFKHFASIELAEKVINDPERLINVLAHEFCHLANFMISGIKDQPHGRQFKEWGRKCTRAFRDRGVEVTTKHTYQIEYKYVWQCSNEECAVEFKRHSKSIDPERHTCGSCRGKLVQIKPMPRSGTGAASGYAAFVKMHFANIKKQMPGASHKEVMEAVGRRYRAEKNASPNEQKGEMDCNVVDLDAVVRELGVVKLDDD